MRISQSAFDLIVLEEVSSKELYEKRYRHPIWPGAFSGATIGIGYDLGHTSRERIIADWKGRVSDEMLAAMLSCAGQTREGGRIAVARVKDKIEIPWDLALEVHKERVIPRWEATVEKVLPNTDKLSPDSFGALVSLTYNRGPAGYDRQDGRYAEMGAIKAHMQAMNFAAIPGEIRKMKRLWPTLGGLLRRRDNEAALFERGLKQVEV